MRHSLSILVLAVLLGGLGERPTALSAAEPAAVTLPAARVPAARAPAAREPAAREPNLVTPREWERTGFQQAGPYSPRFDLRTDFVMAYGITGDSAARLRAWSEAGYVLQLMTGVAWGDYSEYIDGKFDGRRHWDEAQVDAAGKTIWHDPRTPYICPSVAFASYLEQGLRRAIDAGVVAVHLEEPEFWARGGFGEAFQREWRIYYSEPWQRPDSSCDAQYRASKLKHYLYRRTLDRLCSSLKEYAWVKHNRPVRFYVPTHSLINYAQWGIVSPESALVELPGIDGLVAQVWTGTARSLNTYRGRTAERTFEGAYLEYGNMQEMVRGTGRRMWFLHDPIEDNPAHDWDDYRRNYIATLVASLLQPEVAHFEVAPWPSRVFGGRYPAGSRDAKRIPDDYATTLAVVFNQLRDMQQPDVSWEQGSDGVGVLLGDTAMFQRAEPALREGTVRGHSDPTRPDHEEIFRLSGFFGLAMPLVKHGVPVRPVQLDNILRTPGYLDRYRVLLLSYEYQKPLHPGVHAGLVEWVRRGGSLIYLGADTDPFHKARDWWNTGAQTYASPGQHLTDALGLGRNPPAGTHRCGAGTVLIERKHPAHYSRSAQAADELRSLVRRALEAGGSKLVERNCYLLRRGPYIVAATMNESVSSEPLRVRGRLVDLLDASLPVLAEKTVPPGAQAWLLDLDRVTAPKPTMLAAAGRVERWQADSKRVRYTLSSIEGVRVVARLLLPARPTSVSIDAKPLPPAEWTWDDTSSTLLLRHPGNVKGSEIVVEWR